MRYCLIFIFSIFLFSCEEATEAPVQKVDSTIQVEIKEGPGNGGKNIILAAKTEKIFNCSNYILQTDRQNKANGFVIEFTGATLGPICATALGPARTQIDLGVLANGDYPLELNNQSVVNKGILRVTTTQIALLFTQPNGIEILTPVYTRQ